MHREKLTRANPIAVALVGVFALKALVPLRTAIQIGADEGFELAKATLCLHGHTLYTEVWNDQPPLHTFIITQVLRHISPSILGPRLVTTVFTALLLVSVFGIVRRLSGLFPATLATVFLVVSPGFLELSSSCMLEIPALAAAVAGLTVLLPGSRGGRGPSGCRRDAGATFAIGGGALFGVALLMKLDTVIYLPLAGMILWLREGSGQGSPADSKTSAEGEKANTSLRPSPNPRGFFSRLNPLVFFAGSLTITFIAIDWLIDGGAFLRHFHQSWISHFASAQSFEYGSAAEHPFNASILLKNWDTSIPALVGLGVSAILFRKRRSALGSRSRSRGDEAHGDANRKSPPPSVVGYERLTLVPVAWLALMLVVFIFHRPWWSYYYIHIAIPLCWCAAVGIGAVWQRVSAHRSRAQFAVFALVAVCALAWMTGRIYLQVAGIRRLPQTYSSLVLGEIKRFKPYTEWLFTDEPIYSFHAGIPMPPPLAVVPLKRLWSGDMTNARISDELRRFKPGLILLRNDSRETPFNDWLNAEYRLVYLDGEHRLYASRTVLNQARR